MAYTRYNTPAQYSPANTYVPIPFDELLTAGVLRDKQFTENQSAKDAFYTGLRDINVHSADQPLYQRKISDLNAQLQSLQKENPDIGSYDFKRNLDEIISTQSRDPLWRAMRYNATKAAELEKAYNKAKGEGNTPSNLLEMEEALQNFYAKGSEGVGFLGDKSPYKYVDYIDPLEKRGQNFIREGNLQGLYNPDYTLKTTVGSDGVPVREVAAVYGYRYNPSTGLQFAGIPPDFLDSDAGQQMKRDALYRAKQTGGDPNEILQALYQSKTAPLVAKYSGITTKYDQDLTSLGIDAIKDKKLQADQGVYSVPSKRIEDGRDVRGRVEGSEPLFKRLTAGAIDAFDNLTSMRYYMNFDKGKTEVSEQRGTKLVNDIFGKYKNKSEDFDAVKRNILAVRPELKNNPKDLQNAIEDYFDSYIKGTAQMPVGLQMNPKEKDRLAKVWFGGAADNGIVSANQLSGAGINQKVFNPADPSDTKTLGELAGKSNTIEYVGPLKNNNLYKPGIHEIIVDGKTYYMSGTNEEELQNTFDWQLYDYDRHASGIGNWYSVGNTGKEMRTVKWVNPNTKREEVFIQYKPEGTSNDKAKSTTAVPAGTDMYSFFSEKVLPTISK